MHVPDGFVPLWQCAIYYVILIIALYFAQTLFMHGREIIWMKKEYH